jgi:hypothetical protein
MSKNAATVDVMAGLHKLLAQTLTKMISGGDVSGQILGVARQFLKDNGIEASAEFSNELQQLSEALEEFDPDEAAMQ